MVGCQAGLEEFGWRRGRREGREGGKKEGLAGIDARSRSRDDRHLEVYILQRHGTRDIAERQWCQQGKSRQQRVEGDVANVRKQMFISGHPWNGEPRVMPWQIGGNLILSGRMLAGREQRMLAARVQGHAAMTHLDGRHVQRRNLLETSCVILHCSRLSFGKPERWSVCALYARQPTPTSALHESCIHSGLAVHRYIGCVVV